MTAPEPGQAASPLRVLIVDDHTLFRRAVREVIDEQPDMVVVGEAENGEEAVRRAQELRRRGLDLVLMDIDMPRLDGIAATRQILAADPALHVIMLTVSSEDRDLTGAAVAGASGYLPKSLSPTAMVRALRDFHTSGALPMPRTLAARALTHLQQQLQTERAASSTFDASDLSEIPPQQPLSPREQEVLSLIAQGGRDRDIASQLLVTHSTVKKHVKNILAKLDARTRAEAITRFRTHRG